VKFTDFSEKVKPLSLKNYGAFIIDADNTLFDFNNAERAALRDALQAGGYREYTEEVYLRYHHINDELWKLFEQGKISQDQLRMDRFKRLLASLNPPDSGNPGLSSEKIGELYIEALSKKGYLLPHALCVLQTMSQQVPLLLLSNGIARVQRRRIEHSGIGMYFVDILISTEVGLAKPDPRIFTLAVDKLKCPKERILCVGDSPSSDIRGGCSAGLDTCWYAPPEADYPKGEPEPRYRISDLREMLQFLPADRR
jgi:putative hydrolase of the HAD superfamily